MRQIIRLLRFARPYRAQWLSIAGLTLVGTLLSILTPWPMQVLADHVLGDIPAPPVLAKLSDHFLGASGRAAMLWIVIASGFALACALLVIDAMLTSAWVRAGQRTVYDLAEELFARIQRRSTLFHSRSTVGDLLSRIMGDSFCVYTGVELLLMAPTRALLTLALMIVLMARMDPTLTLAALVVAPFMAGAAQWLAPPIRHSARRRRENEIRLATHVQQTLGAIPVVQAFTQEAREARRFRDFADAAIGAQKRNTIATQMQQLATGLISTLGTALVLWIGIRHVLSGQLTLGSALVFLAYLGSLQGQIKTMINLYTAIQNLSVSVDRVSEILDAPSEVVDSPHARPVRNCSGQLAFEQVCFSYEPGRDVLRQLDLLVPAG
ncbi:MAG: ABC transporter transmembrane domain-containing protein, partial [Tepidisphaeraceae bacterium]